MHYAEFAEDEVSLSKPIQRHGEPILIWTQSTALLAAIKEYDANKWKAIGQKVGKPAKVGPDIPLCVPHLLRASTDCSRPASSMRKSTSVESIDNVEHSLHLPGFSAMVPLYDTSFPISVERCTRTTLSDVLSSSLESSRVR